MNLGDLDDDNWHNIAPIAGDIARFIWYLDNDECEIDDHARNLTGLQNLKGRKPASDFTGRIHTADQPYVTMAMRDAVANNAPYACEYRFHKPDGTQLWLLAHGRFVTTRSGERAILGINQDITDLRRRQERADIVAHEMNHRVKNLLAVVTSVFRASARNTTDKAELVTVFEQRLGALASLNSVMMQADQMTTRLTDLVNVILRPVESGKINKTLDEVVLNGTAAQTIALLLNELMTNALKYGGLAADGKGVDLSITTRDGAFRFSWQEHAGREVREPRGSTGFGMSVLHGMTAATFGGNPRLNWDPTGLHFTCEWPDAEMAATP